MYMYIVWQCQLLYDFFFYTCQIYSNLGSTILFYLGRDLGQTLHHLYTENEYFILENAEQAQVCLRSPYVNTNCIS